MTKGEMEEIKEKKGAALKAFGMMMIILASLNLLFFWRAGFPVGSFYPAIMAAGIASFCIGVYRGTK